MAAKRSRAPAEYEDAASVELALRCAAGRPDAAGCGASWSERVPLPIKTAFLAQRLATFRCVACGGNEFVEFTVKVPRGRSK